ncbi:SNF2 family N-terminal domain-containing protein [Gautieria morchelliformis]|nr:SNF2 family N-terminal domain-containing protein [Gautieria morchelliformis]
MAHSKARGSAGNTTSPSSVRTPASTSQLSLQGSQKSTPPTSDEEEQEKDSKIKVPGRVTRSSVANSTSRKRARDPRSEDIDATDSEAGYTREDSIKRRVISNVAYVEITQNLNKKVKGKKPATLRTRTTKKGTARPHPSNDMLSSDEELISVDELEYDEDSFEDSGSEFQLSDQEDIVVGHDSDVEVDLIQALEGMDDDEAENVMVAAAIQQSLETKVTRSNGASSSNAGPSTHKTRSNAAALRAAAAERRLTAARDKNDDGPETDMGGFWDFDSYADSHVMASGMESSSDSEPLANGKGKAKARPSKQKTKIPKKTTVTKAARDKKTFIVLTESEVRKKARVLKNSTRAEETELRKKLGRKLTYAEKTTIALFKYHPELKTVWGDVEESIPITVPQEDMQPAGLKLSLLPFQRESLYWMKKQEKGVWAGGMLADEMGMGKTIQTIALLVADRHKPNLIVAPTVAVMQWKHEIETHTDDFKVLVWYGASREQNIKELQKHDVILTTYAILESCFRKQQSGFKRKGQIVKEKSAMHAITWQRIILDEAHNIKERSTNTAKAAFELKSKYKWCLSGTPLQNRVGELYSLVRFLGGDPFSFYFCKRCDCKSLHWKFSNKRTCDDCGHSPMVHTCFWNNEILTPIQKHAMMGPGGIAFKKLKILLDRMMLRRTKIERADDLGLPPRTVIVRRDYFSEEEKELYLSLFSDAKRQFSTYVDSGTLLNNYSNIFSLITRMRQMACHPDLVLRSKTNVGKLTEDLGETAVCRICQDIAEDAIQSRCRHIFDRECIKQYLTTAVEVTPACPVCHLPLSIDLESPALEFGDETRTSATRQGILGRLDLDTWRSSSKIEALIEELTNLRRQDATTKSLVFSQFVNFLDLIAFRLQRAGFVICRLEGTMSPQARDATIKHFMNNVHVTVFLVSLKAGGVALNLTEASRVYLMDSWWNPAVEYQAMDRIHRLGQHRPVQAIKLVIEDSIESRIVQLQEKKSAMVDATLSTDDSAMGRLTPEVNDLGFLFRL